MGPKNSVYSNTAFCLLLWWGPAFHCAVETSSKPGNPRDIPVETFVTLQQRNWNSKQVCGLGTLGNNNTRCAGSRSWGRWDWGCAVTGGNGATILIYAALNRGELSWKLSDTPESNCVIFWQNSPVGRSTLFKMVLRKINICVYYL